MAIKIIDINLNGSNLTEEHTELNSLLQEGWTLIGNSSYVQEYRYGETNEFSDDAPFERYTLFKHDQTIGEIVANGSGANVFHFDNDDGTIGQMQITETPPASTLDDGEWLHTSDGTEFPTVYNDSYSFTLESFAESLNLHKVLRQYAVERESARVRIAELEYDINTAIETRMAAEQKVKEVEDKAQATALSALNVTTRFEQSAMNAQGEIDTLKSRLQKELNHIVNLEYVINHAFKELRTYDGENGAIIAAKLMLEPYTEPVSTED